MTAKRCWDCGTTFYSDYGSIYCNVCHQAKKTREHNERQAREDRWQAEQAQREHARIQAQHTQALVNAENQRIAAINQQTRAIMESVIKPQDAYNRGYNYPDQEFDYANEAQLEIEVNEYGRLTWQWHHVYMIPTLREQFSAGLSARLSQYKNVLEELKASAYRIGKENAEGTFPDYFTLWTGIEIDGVKIKTKAFRTNFTKVLDETTGELKMNWNKPFENEELNQAYLNGVNEVHWVVNTEEQKNYRLRIEVPKIKAERIIASSAKRYNKIFKVLVFAIPILFFYFVWPITSGWIAFFVFVFSIVLYKLLKKRHEIWQIDNSGYLKQ